MSLEFKIIAALLAFIGIVGAALGWGEHRYQVGVQATTATYELALSRQKVEAAGKYAKLASDLVLAQAGLREFTHSLEKSREDLQRKNDADLRARRAGPRLQFATETPRCGGSGGGTEGTPAGSTADAGPALVQLPDVLDGDLRQLAANAQSLAIDYGTLYSYVHNPALVCELRTPP